MRRTLSVLLMAAGMLAMAGCPIWIDEHGSGGSAVCISDRCECSDHSDCFSGEACIDGVCTPTGNCFYDPCPDGYVCDTWGTCIPEETVSCDEDADCTHGYCDLASGICVDTGLCTTDDDCLGYGESFVCDERGFCAPDRGPCPDGSCGCANDSECEGVGPGGADWLCESGRCSDPAILCTYSYQCEAGAVCVNSFCRVDCSGGAACPNGQVCSGGACVDDADGGGLCTYSSDCAGGTCVNGYCVQACSSSTECAPFEGCQSTMCLPEVDRLADCTAGGCGAGLTCETGVCRMPCAADINCSGSAPFSFCWAGYCRTENEIAAQCRRQLDCLAGLSCVDGACL